MIRARTFITVNELAKFFLTNGIGPQHVIVNMLNSSGGHDVVFYDPAPETILSESTAISSTPTLIATAAGNSSPSGANEIDFEVRFATMSAADPVTFSFEASHDGTDWFTVLGELATATPGLTDAAPYQVTVAGVDAGSLVNIRLPASYAAVRLYVTTAAATGTVDRVRVRRV